MLRNRSFVSESQRLWLRTVAWSNVVCAHSSNMFKPPSDMDSDAFDAPSKFYVQEQYNNMNK